MEKENEKELETDKDKDKDKDKELEKDKVPAKKMNTKDELINNIREWIKIDNDLLSLKKDLKK